MGSTALQQGVPPRVVLAPQGITGRRARSRWGRSSYALFLWLLDREELFDAVHFAERLGLGFFPALAKHQGLAFEKVRFFVHARGPSSWRYSGGGKTIGGIEALEVEFFERGSVEWADKLLCPTEAGIAWMEERGWTLPESCCVLPDPLPEIKSPSSALWTVSATELVFFGGLESMYGIELFCRAIDLLLDRGLQRFSVAFLGPSGTIRDQPSREYLTQRTASWSVSCRILAGLGREEALGYLAQPGRLAVVPYRSGAFGSPLPELSVRGIPFLASDAPGMGECLPSELKEALFVSPEPKAFAERLTQVLREGIPLLRRRHFFSWAESRSAREGSQRNSDWISSPPLVSVCLTHYDRPRLLAQALASLRQQDYPNFEVVLLDDGSSSAEALDYLRGLDSEFEERGWQIVRQSNRYLGAARNAAARVAHGEYLLFMDDDNVADPGEISTFVRVAMRTRADILTCALRSWHTEDPPRSDGEVGAWIVFSGGDAATGVFFNCFGDANALFRKEVFERLGGFTEDRGVGAEDWELFARAVLAGYRLESVPLPLYWYRVRDSGMRLTTDPRDNHLRILRPYEEALPEVLRKLLWAAVEQFELGKRLEERWRLGQEVLLSREKSLHSLEESLHLARTEAQLLRASLSKMESSRAWRAIEWLRSCERKLRRFWKRERFDR
ncbi:Putative glycosyltransferase EpsH [Methylacidimicrobium cyclopophantes]|uniref:Glycosyltransferase EpsH n=1 Tax=Methylacidimicrobium cyclopophantes TaxID=1041766 RepID=A0A5E6MFL9_9BACT|nr:glycosyltransferase [Methylacidimicrobium cyclopophantes]VVM07031.1 Putative glycosyltransferase EpsH [Methylacidimicrobium cyclopophantes]